MRIKAADAPLRTEVVRGKLVISIGINALAFSFDHSEYVNPFDEETGEFRQTMKVMSPAEFAKDILAALNREEEDGTTPLHLLFDAAGQQAAEEGSIGIEFLQEKEKTR